MVAATFVMKRVPGVNVTPPVQFLAQNLVIDGLILSYHGKIQDHPHSFYKQFHIIIAGLDSISARRWINATLVEMAEEDETFIKYLIDGGTEGGQFSTLQP